MTKERFFEIAEEEGIASSDWKEDLWKTHTATASRLASMGYSPCESTVRDGLIIVRNIVGNALDTVLRRA